MTLVLPEQTLIKNLPQDVLLQAIRKGKGYKRSQRVEQYQISRQA